MDATYEAITNYLDDKQLEAKEHFVEEYASDPLTADRDDLGGQCFRAGEMIISESARSLFIALVVAAAPACRRTLSTDW